MKLREAQVDRIVGPTHHFGGLGVGNVASQTNAGQTSNPARAAIQGLDKLREVASLGVTQLVLPPQRRPAMRFLRRLGFSGSDVDVLKRCADEAPHLLSAAMSCSAMWTANAATVSAATDNAHRKLTLSVANLDGSLHRAIESDETLADLRRCFPRARVVPALPGGAALRDEGAANHMRLGTNDNQPGLHLFVYGDQPPTPRTYWPRQTLAACRAIARIHQLPPENTFFLKQHPAAIDAGAFHNDVVAASHHDLMIYHELAFLDADETLQAIARRYHDLFDRPLRSISVREADLTLQQAVECYLFNSQIVNGNQSDQLTILCPRQVEEHAAARGVMNHWLDERIIHEYRLVDLRQSMSGGGGPACLRLRVPMTDAETASTSRRLRWCESLDQQLREIIQQQYPTSVSIVELADINFVRHAEKLTRQLQALLYAGSGFGH